MYNGESINTEISFFICEPLIFLPPNSFFATIIPGHSEGKGHELSFRVQAVHPQSGRIDNCLLRTDHLRSLLRKAGY